MNQPPQIIMCRPLGNLPRSGVSVTRTKGVSKTSQLGKIVKPKRIIIARPKLPRPINPKTNLA
ncbi:hypothetical protein [Peptoniphilus harei]|uniref:hypothetical protein n=1 Tax=Peptoniphilus harei TaxID=54005 RepID=UPI00291C4EEE|nr:hypothetical protein [Peptoniphilus harei]